MADWLLIILGILVGTLGTLIGAGGGFLLVPVLLLLYPDKSPELITSSSLAVVCLNAISGSVAYGFKKRIDYRSALFFCTTTLPGTVLGSYLVAYIPRGTFNLMFGTTLLLLSSYLLIKPGAQSGVSTKPFLGLNVWPIKRSISDWAGSHYTYSYDLFLACLLSFFVGVAASVLGIGGGIIHVPLMVNLLNFPIHIATATSHFILALMGITASGTHWVKGHLDSGMHEIIFIGLGVIIGAQLGAAWSHRLKGRIIIRSLAIAIGLVAVRIFWMSWLHQ